MSVIQEYFCVNFSTTLLRTRVLNATNNDNNFTIFVSESSGKADNIMITVSDIAD